MKKRLIALAALIAVIVTALLCGRSKAYKERARQIKERRRENRKEMREIRTALNQAKEEKTAARDEIDALHSSRQGILAESKRLAAMDIDNAERLRRLTSDPAVW